MHKMKRKLGAKDQAIPKKKAKGKGKGRGKGKGKGRGRGKGKGRGTSVDVGTEHSTDFVDKARKFLKKGKGGTKSPNFEAELEHAFDSLPAEPAPMEEGPTPEETTMPGSAPPVPAEAPIGDKSPLLSIPPEMPEVPAAESEPMEVDEEEAHPKASGSHAPPPGPIEPKRKSPEEILSQLEPPGCKFGMSFHDSRFTSIWSRDHPELLGDFAKKRFSRSWRENFRTWRNALIEVHEHNWKKFRELRVQKPKLYSLGGKADQVPGQIPDSIMDMLKPTIDTMPPVKRYNVAASSSKKKP